MCPGWQPVTRFRELISREGVAYTGHMTQTNPISSPFVTRTLPLTLLSYHGLVFVAIVPPGLVRNQLKILILLTVQ